jgi:hypothetical protein
MLLTVAGSLLIGFMCFALSTSGKISAEFAIVATLFVQVVFTASNVLWFNDNLKDVEFTEVSRSMWTSLLPTFAIVLYFLRDTQAVVFITCTAFMPFVMATVHWVVWCVKNVSFRVSLKG